MKRFKSITEFHRFRHLPDPVHPLISVFKLEPIKNEALHTLESWTYDFYCVGLKHVYNENDIKLKYGQQTYDYDDGILSFVAPNQVLSLSIHKNFKKLKQSGWMMLIHPDFLWNTPLAADIKHYDFWDYSVNEALFLSKSEESQLQNLMVTILQECSANLDKFTKKIVVSHVETLLNYADRFYHRQFITREKSNHQVLERLERLLNDYFNNAAMLANGLPTVNYLAGELNLSPKYLSSLLKVLTGQNTQQHIHEKLIDKAKEKLSTTSSTVSEIAYQLGFEHLQSFSKLFKTKTNQSPVEFRASFN